MQYAVWIALAVVALAIVPPILKNRAAERDKSGSGDAGSSGSSAGGDDCGDAGDSCGDGGGGDGGGGGD